MGRLILEFSTAKLDDKSCAKTAFPCSYLIRYHPVFTPTAMAKRERVLLQSGRLLLVASNTRIGHSDESFNLLPSYSKCRNGTLVV